MDPTNAVARASGLLQWYLQWAVSRDASGPGDAEVCSMLGTATNPDVFRGFLRSRKHLVDGADLSSPVEQVPGRFVAEGVNGAGIGVRLVAVVRPDGQAHVNVVKGLPEGYHLRDAVPEDGAALSDLCRRTPIVTGDVQRTIDYGDDYLAATAMVSERDVLVVEHEGRLLALHSQVRHRAQIGQDDEHLAYIRHTRVDPAAQGAGLFSALNGALFERGFAASATPYSLVAVGNDSMFTKLPEELRRWPWRHTRFFLDCRAIADGAADLAPVDTAHAALLIGELHQGHALNPFPTAASVDARLRLAPDLYGPDRLLGNDDAALGVSRRPQVITTRIDGSSVARREAVALDVGATDLVGFEKTLVAYCSLLADEDVDQLAIDASTGSALHELLGTLAASETTYALNLQTPPPDPCSGLWVDAAIL